MLVKLITTTGTWRDVADAARVTIGKDAGHGEPPVKWKKRILLAEHSPIRLLGYTVDLEKLPAWVSTHLVRHKIGIEHFVSTARPDRTGKARSEECSRHRIKANAQACINTSRKRLCRMASPETRQAWGEVVSTLPLELQEVCVPECVYRGFCPEFKTCGYADTQEYKERLEEYRYG